MKENKFLQSSVSLKQKIALVLFGLFLFFVLLEAGLRLGGFILLSIQEHRNRECIKERGTFRILCLGESTTQRQYPHFLEEILNQRNIGIRFSVIDEGMAGISTLAILDQVEANLVKYHPDMVIAMMGVNDLKRHIPYEALSSNKGMLLLRSFRAYKLARLLWLHIVMKIKEISPAGLVKYSRLFLRYQPGDPGFKLISVCFAEERLSDVREYHKEGVGFDPGDNDAYLRLGLKYQNEGKLSEAEECYKKAIELNPKNEDVYVGLGFIYTNEIKRLQAEECYKKAIELNPKNDRAYLGLGWEYYNEGKLSEAEECYKKAIEFNPGNDSAYLRLGLKYQNEGKLSEAEECYKKAIELDPSNEENLGTMASLYQEEGQRELAQMYYNRAHKLRMSKYSPAVVSNYRKLKETLDRKGVRLVCAQYPMRSIEPLKKILAGDEEGVIFVNNEQVFKDAVSKEGYKAYFCDMFGGDFGHCTAKGNRLLAENIANTILREAFGN